MKAILHVVSGLLLACSASAQVPETRPAPRAASTYSGVPGTRLILLGTAGGPLVQTARSQPASLLVVDGRPYLIDCGDVTVRQLKLAGFDAADAARVFLTHLHFDHTAGLAALFGFNWVSGNRQLIEVFGPPGTSDVVKQAVRYLEIPEQLYSVQMPPHPNMASASKPNEFDVSAPMLVYRDDKIRVTAVENSHYSTMHLARQKYGAAKSYAYRFETADRTIVFTGDSGPSPAVERLARGADILVSNVTDTEAAKQYMRAAFRATDEQLKPLIEHQQKELLSPEEVGKLASAAGVKLVVLSHLAPSDDVKLDTLRFTRGVRQFYSGPVVAGRDLDQF